MRHKIICIDRMCGSGGKEIGRLVSKKLGIGFHDSNLLELAKEHGGITSSSLDDSDEKATNPFYYKLIYEGNENVKQEQPATDAVSPAECSNSADRQGRGQCDRGTVR